MISVALNPEIEQRLAELAKSRGLSEGDFARELIEACIEDLDDIQMAAGRVENRQPALTAEHATIPALLQMKRAGRRIES